MSAPARRPLIESEAERRGRLASDTPGELHFADQYDAVNFFAGRARSSKVKYTHLAKDAGVVPGTISKLASGQTRWPRWSTMFGTALALGLEVTITTRRKH